MVMLKDLISKYFVLYEVPLTDNTGINVYDPSFSRRSPRVVCPRA